MDRNGRSAPRTPHHEQPWSPPRLSYSLVASSRPPASNEFAAFFTVSHLEVVTIESDAHGKKMSKSRGNAVSPQTVMNTLGADILRLWVSATDFRGEISVSDEIMKRTADAYRRIRNTARYLLANLDGFDAGTGIVKPEDLLDLDRWVLYQTQELQKEIISAYDTFQFHHIYQKIHQFCVVMLGNFYLDIIKDRIYTTRIDSVARRSSQTVMYYIVESFVRWIAPVLSFTAEEIWQHIPGDRDDSVFLDEWYQGIPELTGSDDMVWNRVINIRDEVSKVLERLRIDGLIGSGLDAEVSIYCGDENFQALGTLEDELRYVLITSYASVYGLESKPDDATESSISDVWIKAVPSQHAKCIRCWHHRADVGENKDHPEICPRCVDNVEGEGETRLYA